MNSRIQLRVPLVLLLFGSLAGAQSAPVKGPEMPAAGKASAAAYEPTVSLTFHVTGLTQDNLGKVREGLNALTYSTYACDHCHTQRAEAGKCAQCGAELKAEKRPLFTSVTPSASDSTIALVLNPNHRTRFSAIEGALRAESIAVVEATLPIPGQAELVLRGGKADEVAAVEKALKDAKLFDDLHASWDAATGEILVDARAGLSAPTRARVDSAMQGMKLHVKDVIWGHAPAKT